MCIRDRLKLVRKIASEFGVDSKGHYADVYEDLVYYLRSKMCIRDRRLRAVDLNEVYKWLT